MNTQDRIRHGQAANLVITNFFSTHSVASLSNQENSQQLIKAIETIYYLLQMSENNVFNVVVEEEPKKEDESNLLDL